MLEKLKNKPILINSDLDGIISGLLLKKYLNCTIVGFTNSAETIWLQKGFTDFKNACFVDMYVTNPEGAEKYIVTFWSTSCSHCLKEIPELYNFTKELYSVKVIAVALEEDKFGFNHHTEMMDKWINVLGLNKWENEIARSYEIHSTPSYFILDKDKKITEKPEQLVELLHSLGAEKEVLESIVEKLSKE